MDDIKKIVDSFYSKIQIDQLLGGIFNGIIKDNWPLHLEKMYRFWQTVLLDDHTYKGSPFVPHARLPLEQQHFDRWLHLFNAVIDEYFEGANATKAKLQGERMATMFLSKIQYYKANPLIPIL